MDSDSYLKEPLGEDLFLICKPLFVECELHHNPVLLRSYDTKCMCKRSLLNHYERERERGMCILLQWALILYFLIQIQKTFFH